METLVASADEPEDRPKRVAPKVAGVSISVSKWVDHENVERSCLVATNQLSTWEAGIRAAGGTVVEES